VFRTRGGPLAFHRAFDDRAFDDRPLNDRPLNDRHGRYGGRLGRGDGDRRGGGGVGRRGVGGRRFLHDALANQGLRSGPFDALGVGHNSTSGKCRNVGCEPRNRNRGEPENGCGPIGRGCLPAEPDTGEKARVGSGPWPP
jgi:hypothetical protein